MNREKIESKIIDKISFIGLTTEASFLRANLYYPESLSWLRESLKGNHDAIL